MANYSISNLLASQSQYTSRFTEAELRYKRSPILSLGLGNSAVLPDYETLRKREDRALNVYMLQKSARTVGAARTHNHTGTRGASYTVTPTWSTISATFSISAKQLDTNVFSFEEAFRHQMFEAAVSIHIAAETAGKDFLYTNRTQVATAGTGGNLPTWSAGPNYSFETPVANRARFASQIKATMNINNYFGPYDVLYSAPLFEDSDFYSFQGNANSVNTQYQFGNINRVLSNEFTDANYVNGSALAMEQGSYAVLPWIPPINRRGQGDMNSVLGGYGAILDPTGSGMTMAVHGYRERADTSGSNGSAQDDLIQMELSVDIANILAPLSTANESPVYEFSLIP